MFPMTRWVKTKVPFFVRLILAWVVWLMLLNLVAAWLRGGGRF